MRSPLRRADAGLVLLAVLLVGRFAWLAPRLLVSDLNVDYPFAAGDAWDWIANGLFYTGADVRFSARPPLVPLAMAGLAEIGALAWFPVVVQALWTATLLVLYRLLRSGFSAPVAAGSTLVVAASQTLNHLSLEVMADLPAACLLLLAVAALAAAAERPRRYLAAGGAAAAAYLAAPVGLAAAAAGAAAVALRRRRHLRQPALWAGAATVAAAVAGWALARRVLLGGEPPLQVTWRLVRPHLDDLDGTLWAAAVVVGWPALLLAVVGTLAAVRRVARRDDPGDLRLLALVAGLLPLAFFALLYDFPDRRFLAYAVLPGAVLLAEGLAAVGRAVDRLAARRRAGASATVPGSRSAWAARNALVGLAGAAAVLWAAWPVPAPVPNTVLVAPPALYAQARFFGTPEGGLRIEPATARGRRRAAFEVASWSWWSRVARASAWAEAAPEEGVARRAARERARRAADAAKGVLFVDARHRIADRYRVQSQLGNALGRHVVYVPDDLFAGRWEWLAAGGVEPVAEVGDWVLWTVAPPGLGGRWLLATQAWREGPTPEPAPPPIAGEAAGDEVEGEAAGDRASVAGITIEPSRSVGSRLEAAAPPREDDEPTPRFLNQAPPGTLAAPTPSPPPSAVPPADRAAAGALAAALPGATRLVALQLPDGPPPPLAAWLPFLLDTTELYVIPGSPPAARPAFDPAPATAPRRFGPARLVERRWRGEAVWVIEFPLDSYGARWDAGAECHRRPRLLRRMRRNLEAASAFDPKAVAEANHWSADHQVSRWSDGVVLMDENGGAGDPRLEADDRLAAQLDRGRADGNLDLVGS
jgi:hypothetical protein